MRSMTCTRVRTWRNPREKTQGKRGALPSYDVTDPALADFLAQRGWSLREIEESSTRWMETHDLYPDLAPVRQHQRHLCFRFVLHPGLLADVRDFEREHPEYQRLRALPLGLGTKLSLSTQGAKVIRALLGMKLEQTRRRKHERDEPAGIPNE